ncbi:hypothetical protein T09_9888 [Trichinella sp. T9]|nr:hypothetical protein T09_9888 [Trichinella sp. T9]
MESDEIQFVSTQRNQQKLMYRGWCYTLKRTNRNDKYWICASVIRSCRGIVSTNLEVTEVIRLSEHAKSCPANPHAFHHHQQLAEWRRLVSEDTMIRVQPISPSCLLKYALQADGPRKISVFGTGHCP